MILHRRGRRAVAAAFALTLLAAACGGDGDDSASSTTPPEASASTASTASTAPEETTTSTEPEEEGPDVEAAQALAESINLTLEDFSQGWEASPSDDDGDDDDGVSQCFEDADIDAVEVAQADSPTFSISNQDGSQGQVAQSSTIVLDEEASAQAVMDEIGTDRFADCANDLLVDSLEGNGNEVTDSGMVVVEDQGGLGDESVGLAGAISFGSGGSQSEGQIALYFIRVENVVAGVQILDIGDVAFEETLADLLDLVDRRLTENV